MSVSFPQIATQIGALVEKKNAAYGSSFAKSGAFLRLLYPDGISPENYDDVLLLARVFDKQMRIATNKDALGESPWEDIAGYAILGASTATPKSRCSRPGERNGRAKLTRKTAYEIKRRYADGATTTYELAAEFGVDRKTISNVLKGRTWSTREEEHDNTEQRPQLSTPVSTARMYPWCKVSGPQVLQRRLPHEGLPDAKGKAKAGALPALRKTAQKARKAGRFS